MKTKRFASIFLLLLLVALAPGIAVAQQDSNADSAPSTCDSAEVIRPGDTVTDELSEELAAHTDIAQVSTSISGRLMLTAVFHLRDLPQTLTFNRPGTTPGSIEYSWEVWVDLDDDPGTGFMGGFEYILSAYHTVSEEENGGKLKASTWSLGIDGPKPVLDARAELSAEADTITITGGVPRLKPEVRLAFKSTDALGGTDQAGCFPIYGERVIPGDCESGPGSILPGQTAVDEISHSLPPHIDITEVETYMHEEILTVVFHFRELPFKLTFDRPGAYEGQMEYVWEALVDVDNDKEPFTPGDSVTDDVADVQEWGREVSDESADADNAHIDITGIDSSLSGEKLTVVFHLRDLPETLTFNRTGITKSTMEYWWQVHIDVDNNRNTGFGGGYEYLLSAYHVAFGLDGKQNRLTPVSYGLRSDVWRISARRYDTFGESSYIASAEADTITLFGTIPGITANSRLTFVATDALRGEDYLECHLPMNQMLFPGPCGTDEAMIKPRQTIAHEVSDELPAHVDLIGVSTALSGETLAVVFHLRDVPENLVFNREGVDERAYEYGWEVSIDVDPGQENGQFGLDYEMSATHIVLPENVNSSTTAAIGSKVETYTSKRIQDSFRKLEDAAIVVSPLADTITLVGDIPGITPDSRLIFNAYDSLNGNEHVECQELPSPE